jgi:hypothetical protein
VLAGLSEWLDAYGSAWEARDAQAACDLFTEDAVLQWDPFGQRLRGRVMIREAWAEAFEQQQEITFGYEVLTATQRGGIARWWCDSSALRMEGIFKLAFDESGLCTDLHAWWNAQDGTADSAT